MTLYILSNYNNYYNRIVKFENTVEEYSQKSTVQHTEKGANFIPNDGINTQHVVGTYDYDGQGNYLLVANPNNEIISRWFIIDSVRTRAGQYQLTLRRDVVVDYYNIIINSPMFIEKATLSGDDPFIYNSEDMTFNQIKTSEYPLKDGTNCAWIVGYYDPAHTDTDHPENKIYVEEAQPGAYDLIVDTTFNEWEFKKYTNEDFIGDPTGMQYIIATHFNNDDNDYKYVITETSDSRTAKFSQQLQDEILLTRVPTSAEVRTAMANTSPNGFKSYYAYVYSNGLIKYHISNGSTFKNFQNYNNKIVRFSAGEGQFEYKRISITSQRKTITKTVEKESSLWDLFVTTWQTNLNVAKNIIGTPFSVSLTTECYTMNVEDIYPDMLRGSISTSAYTLIDAPYGMFAIPYPQVGQNIVIKNTASGEGNIVVNAESSMRIAQAIAKKYKGGQVLYDLQLLPYCPVQKIIQEDGSLDLNDDNFLYSYITSGDDNVSVILNAQVSSFTLNIPFEQLTVTNKKIQSQTDMCRLVSPNFNGQFEFNVAKNDGLQFFNVDCTYLPINPYIHLNPNFGGLYGQDFNDARGLVCGGDFSLPIVNDAWETYKLQNKNYQNIFDRQIQNMEIQNKYQKVGDIVGSITGSFGGSVSGAFAGSMIAPGWGTAVGAIVGGVASTAGGIADIVMNEKLRNEAIDFTKDQFGYQLGNIQAMPNSLARTTAFTYNNKIFPILEYYTCTELEKEALANKIAYNGMTVMRIGIMNDYIQNEWSYSSQTGINIVSKGYIKGKLIKFDEESLSEVGEYFNLVNAISGELDKGVYIK